jgi:3-oxoacyl-[acyl-carrier-protein] synthase-3
VVVHYRARIIGTGSFLPARVLTNHDLERMVDTTDEWITQRTGIKERRLVDPGTPTSALALEAAKEALAAAGMGPQDISLIVLATITPDTLLPATACWVQHRLGATHAGAVDIMAACSGFLYALSMAATHVHANPQEKVLVIGAETLSYITDFTDRASCILFGDGAGAAVVARSDDPAVGFGPFVLGSDGRGAEMMIVPAGGSLRPASHQTLDERLHYMKLRGREVYKFAVIKMVEMVAWAMEEGGISRDDLKLVIPHQVNVRILEAAAKRLDLPMEKIYVNIERYGNTSAASVPIALDEAVRAGKLGPGDPVVLVAFGGGLTWAACSLRW